MSLRRNPPIAEKLLHLQDNVGEEQREAQTSPNDRFSSSDAKPFPAGDAEDHAHFQKDQSYSEAAGSSIGGAAGPFP